MTDSNGKVLEKDEEIFIEDISIEGKESAPKVSNVGTEQDRLDAGNRASEERRLVRKIDMWLLPTVFLIWIMNYIDASLTPFINNFLLRLSENRFNNGQTTRP